MMGAEMEVKNEKGQALVELILFLPLMFTVYALVSGFANAIYGSINQQKFARNYFYYRVQNNSTTPKRPDDTVNWTQYGMYYVGWREKVVGEEPVQPCYRISLPILGANSETCDSNYTSTGSGEASTQFMRVGTVYGFCGATYVRNNKVSFLAPNRPDLNYRSVTDESSCLIAE